MPNPLPSVMDVEKKHSDIAVDAPVNDQSESSDSEFADDAEDIDGDYGSYGNHVFSDPKVAAYWADVYEKATYEGRHRFDPTFTWSATEEKRVKRKVRVDGTHSTTNADVLKIDFRIMTWCWTMFVALELNRRNINRGRVYRLHPAPADNASYHR